MYDPRGLAITPIEPEVHHHVHDVAGIGLHSAEVVDVRPLIDGDRVVSFDVIGGAGEVTRARNLVVASRPTPSLPDGFYGSERIWHTSEVRPRLAGLTLNESACFVVAGSEPDAADSATDLRRRFPHAEICSIADASRVTDVLESDAHVVVVLGSPGDEATSLIRADAIVFATGYEPGDPARLLGAAAAYCRRDARGDLRIGPDGRVQTTDHVVGAIYVRRVGAISDSSSDAFVRASHAASCG
jgi:lysine/ornithine N-monooxygenase